MEQIFVSQTKVNTRRIPKKAMAVEGLDSDGEALDVGWVSETVSEVELSKHEPLRG